MQYLLHPLNQSSLVVNGEWVRRNRTMAEFKITELIGCSTQRNSIYSYGTSFPDKSCGCCTTLS